MICRKVESFLRKKNRASNKIHPRIRKNSEYRCTLKRQVMSNTVARMEDLRLKDFIKHEACLITSVVRSDEDKSASND